MKIGTRLVLRFAIIVSTILFCFSFIIYYFFSLNRENEFYSRLNNRAVTTAKLLIKVKEVDKNLLEIINRNTVNALSGERIAIFNYLNKNIYHHEKTYSPISVPENVLNEIRLKKELRFKLKEQDALGILYEENNEHFVVIISATDNLGTTQINYLKGLLSTGFIISVIVILLAGWFFVRKMLMPISDIINQVGLIKASNLSLRIEEGNNEDEISRLAKTFNNMIQGLENAFIMQKRFVANASHELRTPLTAIMGQIEVTLMKKRAGEEYENTLNSILEDIKNLNRLTNGLLKLAQVDYESNNLKFSPLRIDELLRETREELLKRNNQYAINLEFDSINENATLLIIEGNKSLLKTAFLNLMDNGCKYSFDNSISIRLNFSNGLKIIFSDKGRGIPKSDMEKIFQPFFRGEKVQHLPGYGLGLSITEKIIKLHNGEISVNSNVGEGTSVGIRFFKG